MKALILSVTAGYGHHSTGQAAINALEECGFECTMLDTLEYVNTHLANSVSDGYLFSTKYLSGAYGKAYGTLDKREQKYDKRSIFAIFSKIVSRKLKNFFKNYTPDVVIGTHSYACMLMTYLKDKGIITCPTFGIITDFTVHPFWESTELDYYVTADALLNRQMQKKGIPESKILPYGIPIKKKFSTGYEKKDARELLGISDKRTILVMMGSMGYGNIIENLHAIDSLSEDFQVICVCGNNKKAKEEISSTVWEHSVFTYGFVDNIDVMMDASDCIVTKPGGLTTSEFLAKGLPAIILDPIPGQEDRNMEFLVNNGAALMVTETFPLDEALYQLLKYPWRMELLSKSVEHLGKKDAAANLAGFITGLVSEKNAEPVLTT